jgi:NAD(P)H-hydrate epimerase
MMNKIVWMAVKGVGVVTSNDLKQLPSELYSAEQVQELDRIAIAEYGLDGFSLMSRAGLAVVDLIESCYPDASIIHVFCGSGNNGGDGFVVANEALKKGLKPLVFLLCPVANVTGDARLALDEYLLSGGAIDTQNVAVTLRCDVIVDALLGTGLSRKVSGQFEAVIEHINTSGRPVVAIDIPSGLNSNTGQPMPCAVVAQQTITFIGLKKGMVTGQASAFCGDLFFSSLAIPGGVFGGCQGQALLTSHVSLPPRNRYAHKGDFGHVVLIGGDYGYHGAIQLAAEASTRAGAGLVSVATRIDHARHMVQRCPEIMVHGVEQSQALSTVLNKGSVIAIGPGLGQKSWGEALFEVSLTAQQPKVLDADALNILAKRGGFSDNWILTPHPGEAARLMHCSVDEIQRDRYTATRNIQSKYGGVVLLKGPGTIITDGNITKVTMTGNPGMACGGMGDVLTGIIAALVAQKMSLMDAAVCGAFLHGKAGDEAALQGERGLVASDLMPYIRTVVNES